MQGSVFLSVRYIQFGVSFIPYPLGPTDKRPIIRERISEFMKDNIYPEAESKEKVLLGIKKGVDAVKVTLGPKGANVLVEHDLYPGFQVINDGLTVLMSIHLEDRIENMGLNMLKEAVGKHNKEGGDGSTTAAVLTGAIVEEGSKYLSECSPMELRASLEACLPVIEESIDAQTKEITVDEVGKVATVSAEDDKLGQTIQEIYQKIGKDGILYPDINSKGYEDYITYSEGVKIDSAGLATPYMSDVDEKTGQLTHIVRLKDPKILIVKNKLVDAKRDFDRLFGYLNSSGVKDVVIFYDDADASVINDLVVTRIKNGFRAVLVKMPVIFKDHWFEDLALLTGSTIIDSAKGLNIRSAKSDVFGTCGQIVIPEAQEGGKEFSTFLDGTLDVSEHIKTLEQGNDDDKNRAARLNTKTARLHVGAHSETSLRYRSLKLDDARNAAYQALHGGIVSGGGVCLRNTIYKLPNSVGGEILKAALQYPEKQIETNAGAKPNLSSNPGVGLNARTGKHMDMIEAGIWDSAKITKSIVRNAISVAATVLTHRGAVTLQPKVEQPTP
jgi:chaperonin GroEL